MAKDLYVPVSIRGRRLEAKAQLGQTVIVTEGTEKYTPAPITPSESRQTIPTKDKQLTADVVVEPIPSEYIVPTGSMEITENGQYDITEKASVNVDVPSGVETVTGEVTISNYGNFPIITHNFGTKKIGLIIYPISEVVCNAGYLRFYLSYINVNDIVGGVNWPLNFTSYNSKFSDTVNANAYNLRTIATQLSPWTTQNTWYVAQQPDSQYNSGIVLTNDTINSISYKWCNGTYRYIVYKLG